MTRPRPAVIEKPLSANDTGQTGSHQAGLLVPKSGDVLLFFPNLDSSQKNPRRTIRFVDEHGEKWTFVFIHYNNRLFGGTRNEYRLTCMTEFFRRYGLRAGDVLRLTRLREGHMRITFSRAGSAAPQVAAKGKLRLANHWRVIHI